MKRFLWYTDLHLDHLSPIQSGEFYKVLSESTAEGLFLTGDMAQGNSLIYSLDRMSELFSGNIYFVLGNHDYYQCSIEEIRKQVEELCVERDNLIWLSSEAIIRLCSNQCLLGHDSWYDGRNGNYVGSMVQLSDFSLIRDFIAMSKSQRLHRFQELADEAVEHVKEQLPVAMQNYQQVKLLTHVPPFREASFYNGEISGDDFLPYFSCRILGETIFDIAKEYPESNLQVFCGHTHHEALYKPASNVTVQVGHAEYGSVMRNLDIFLIDD